MDECFKLMQEVETLRLDLEKEKIFEHKFKATFVIFDELIVS